MATNSKDKDDGIDYRSEGSDSGETHEQSTDKGYDEAAHSGAGAYGVAEGAGGVFGTTGGGTYSGGMHVVERPVIEETERGEDEPGASKGAQDSKTKR